MPIITKKEAASKTQRIVYKTITQKVQPYEDPSITKIEEIEMNYSKEILEAGKEYEPYKSPVNYVGYKIHLKLKDGTAGAIEFVTESEDFCVCEDWGCILTNDTTKEFIGAKLISVDRTYGYWDDDASEVTIFITLKTDKGDLQFTVYSSGSINYGRSIHYRISWDDDGYELPGDYGEWEEYNN